MSISITFNTFVHNVENSHNIIYVNTYVINLVMYIQNVCIQIYDYFMPYLCVRVYTFTPY